jgi:hypothetical protein
MKPLPAVERSIRALYRKLNMAEPRILYGDGPYDAQRQMSVLTGIDTVPSARTAFFHMVWAVNSELQTQRWAKEGRPTAQLDSVTRDLQRSFSNVRAMAIREAIDSVAREAAEANKAELNSIGIKVDGNATRAMRRHSEREQLSHWISFPGEFHPKSMVHNYEVVLLPATAFVIAPPLFPLKVDNLNRMHCDDGPAIEFPDGWKVWAVEGIAVDEQTVMRPETLTPRQIRQQRNIEVRRVMTERLTLKRYLELDGAVVIAEDTDSLGLPRRLWRSPNGRAQEVLVAVEVQNSTLEPDGTRRTYMLRVPPATRTPVEGVAWTFNMRPEEYQVAYES